MTNSADRGDAPCMPPTQEALACVVTGAGWEAICAWQSEHSYGKEANLKSTSYETAILAAPGFAATVYTITDLGE